MTTLIINIIAIAWFTTQLQYFVGEFNQILKNKKYVLQIPFKIMSCIKCSSFWITLIYTQDILLAIKISLLATILSITILNKEFNL